MITHNGKYLSVATHHGMPIYAATMGGKMVIRQWLPLATQQAIVAAFGAEGTEVIAKTNDYLNRIATTDPQRALQISGFINEDPMLVCSLVETSKVRTATIRNKSVDNHLYNGLILPTPFSAVGKMEMTIQTEHNKAMILSGATSNTTMSGYYSFGGNNDLDAGTITRLGTWSLNALVSVGLDFVTNTKAQNIRICGWKNGSWNYDVTIKNWDIYGTNDITPLYLLVPFLTTEGEVCFLDLVNLQLHHNVYTDPFTIAITPKTTETTS